ncbi:YdaU family protein [Acinetobacter sp. VNK23]|uniref:YdaU family protein n=1 Tax=Acinetobacter thutiue TaxID=2998078 RepID=UPI002575AC21|nr:YdaU family protein [Acinetobacter thutiue]MDM1021634.1 YdaU family protein [Acinetobacter thutiue]
MHYYERNIGDYHRKAGRLNILQHGVYNLLIDACYDRETFPTTLEEAIDWVWATSPEEIEAVKFVLKKFFNQNEDGVYIQKHIQEDLNSYKSFIGKQSDNGKKGGRPKGSKNKKNNSGNDGAGGNPSASDTQGGNPEDTQEKPTETQINPDLPKQSQTKPKPITNNHETIEPNNSSGGNNAHEEKIELPPVQFATYQVEDQRFYSLLEFVNQYSQFQNDFVDLAYPRYPTVLSVDFQALMQGYCDHFAAKNGKNTPSIWFVKWLSWIQNNLQDVINRREKQQVPEHQSKQPAGSAQPQKSYFERIAEEKNENSMRDVTPVKKPMVV